MGDDKKKTEQRHQQILMDLLKQPENRVCCDCPEKGPRWASWNIGCFLCLRCAGIHRRMGTHISRVKSVTLDSWTEEQIESIRSKGNAIVNAQYNPYPERHPPPPLSDDAAHEQYIRDKYERKLFSDERGGHHHHHHHGYESQLRKLRDMGFVDMEDNVAALKKTNGDVNGAVNILISQSSKPSTPAPNAAAAASAAAANNFADEQRMSALESMGFKDKQANRRALQQTRGDVKEAVQLLMKDTLNQSNPPALAPPSSSRAGTAAPVPTAAAKQPVNLLGDDDPFGPAPVAASNHAASNAAQNNGFANFTSAPAPGAPAASSGLSDELFGAFGGAAPAAAGPPKASKNDILSLFSSPPAGAPGGPAAPNPFGGAPAPGAFPGAPVPGAFGAPAPAAPGYGAPGPAAYGMPGMPPAQPGYGYGQPNPYAQPAFGGPPPMAGTTGMFPAAAGGMYPQPAAPFGNPAFGARPPMGGNPYAAAPAAGAAYNPFGGAMPGGPSPMQPTSSAFGAPAPSSSAAANPFSSPAKPASDPFASLGGWK